MRRPTGSAARRRSPRPIHPGGPPIWLGGQGPRGLRMAARLADGWNYASNLDGTLAGFIERRDIVLRECEAIGRDPAEVELSVQVIIPPDGEPRRAATTRGDRLRTRGRVAHPADDPRARRGAGDPSARHRGCRADPRRLG